MKHIDELFRDGLAGRQGEVPANLWEKIRAARPPVPAGERLDEHFRRALQDREAAVPAGMWDRIVAARALPRRRAYYALAALASLLLLLGLLYLNDTVTPTLPTPVTAPAASPVAAERSPVATKSSTQLATSQPVNASASNNALQSGAAAGAGEVGSTPRPARITPATTQSADPTVSTATINEAVGTAPAGSQVTSYPNTPLLPSLPGTSDRAQTENATQNTNTTLAVPPLRTELAPLLSLDEGANLLPDFRKKKYRVQPVARGFSRAPRHRTQTEMLFGAAYANQTLTAATAEDRNALAARENSEFPEVSYQITLRQAYRLNDRFLLRGGLTYLDIRNQIDYEELVGNSVRLTRRNNHIRILEVPLLAGITIPGKRLSASLNVGPVFNLTTSVQGRYLSPDQPEPIDFREAESHRSYTGVGYMTSLTTTYAIGKKQPFILVLEPFFKNYPGSFTRPGQGVRESYWLAGLQLGVRRSL